VVAAIDGYGTFAYVWDANTGKLLAELPNAQGETPSLTFSPAGDWLVTCGGGYDVRVFDTRTWAQALSIPGRQISSLSFDPTGPRLATASWSGDASIWAIPTGTRVHHLQEVGDKIHHIAFSPDGGFIVTASDDGAERVWDAREGKLHASLKNHRDAVLWAEFDPASKLVVSAGVDGVVAISDVATGVPVSVLEGPRRVVLSAHFDPASRRVVAASWDGTARVWDATPSYRRWNSPPIGDDCGTNVSQDGDHRFIAISCAAHGSYIWDTAQDRLLAHLPSVTRPPGEVLPAYPAVSAAGDLAAIADGAMVVIYALPGGRPVRTILHPAAVNAVAFARTGHDLVSASIDGSLLITRDASDPFALTQLPGGIDAVGFVPDGRIVVAGSRGGLRVYDPRSGRILAEVALAAKTRVRAFRVSSDSRRLITIPKPGKPVPPELWDLEHYRKIRSLETSNAQVLSAHFVRGDSQILTAGTDGAVGLWDAMTGDSRQTNFGASGYMSDAALAPDGSMVVMATPDGRLRFWDVSSGRTIWTLHAHKSRIDGVHFEGTDIVTRSSTGEISRWKLAPHLPAKDFLDRYIRCLPLRFNEKTGGLVDQQQPCDISADRTP
jgi:WD40 repeat protein